MNKKQQELQELKESMGCHRECYTNTDMCPNVERCPVTRDKEGKATIFASVAVLLFPIVMIAVVGFVVWGLASISMGK